MISLSLSLLGTRFLWCLGASWIIGLEFHPLEVIYKDLGCICGRSGGAYIFLEILLEGFLHLEELELVDQP